MAQSSGHSAGGFTALMSSKMAFFTWDLQRDLVFGDCSLASLFEITADELAAGTPILPFVEKIYVEDRARVAKAIHDAIRTGSAYQEAYRIYCSDSEPRSVVAVGRCFRCAEGVPTLYSGVVIEVTGAETITQSDPLEMHCRAALEIAEIDGRHLAARYLSSALGVIRNQIN